MNKAFIILTLFISLSSPIYAQLASDSSFIEIHNGEDFIQLFQKMVEMEIVFEAPSENFVKNQAGDGYINPHNQSQIVALYIPIPYQQMLPQIIEDNQEYEVMESNTLIIKGKKCFYRKEKYPDYENREDFIGVMVFMPSTHGTISIAAAFPKSLEKEYCKLFMHSVQTLRIIE